MQTEQINIATQNGVKQNFNFITANQSLYNIKYIAIANSCDGNQDVMN